MTNSEKEDLASQRAKISKEIHDLKDELFSMQNSESNSDANDEENNSGSENENEDFYDVIDNAFEFNNKLENDQKMSEVSQFLKDHEKKRLNLVSDPNDSNSSSASKSAPLKMLQSPSSFFNMRKSANKKRNSVISSPIIDETSHSTNTFFNNIKSERLNGSAVSLAIDRSLQEETNDKKNNENQHQEHKDERVNNTIQNIEESAPRGNNAQPAEQDDEKDIITYKKSFNESNTEGNDQSNFEFEFEFSKLKIDEEKMKFSDSIQKLAERSTDELNKQYQETDTPKKSLLNDKNRSSGSISRKLKRYSNNYSPPASSSVNNNTSESKNISNDDSIKKKNETTSTQLINSETMQQKAKQLMMLKSAKKKWKGGSTGGYVLSKIFSIFGGK